MRISSRKSQTNCGILLIGDHMFKEILDSGLEPGISQIKARDIFPEIVRSSHLKLISPGDVLPNGRSIILGIAIYYPESLKLLDEIEENYLSWQDNIKVFVFDISSIKNLEDFRKCIPMLEISDVVPTLYGQEEYGINSNSDHFNCNGVEDVRTTLIGIGLI